MAIPGAAGKESDFLKADIACLNPRALHATLISSLGNHCQVWRTSKRDDERVPLLQEEDPAYLEFVIKYPVIHYSDAEIRLLARHYRLLRRYLDDIIPDALFFITRINGRRNICVLARAVNIWFNIANPQFQEEAIPLLQEYPKARNQLERFITTADALRHSDNPRLIDLYGLDNLVLDNNREIRFVDSFDVFFFEDMIDLLKEEDPELQMKINISLERLDYLKKILAIANREATAGSKSTT
jgi:hypothetical protein